MRDQSIQISGCRFLGVSLLSTILLLSVPSWAQSQPAADAPSAEVSEEELNVARLHFKNGVDLLQQQPPNYQDAYRQFELAYEKSGQSWKVLGNLGLSALKLERDGEALQFYREYLANGGDEIDPGERSHIERELLLIKGNMATLSLKLSDPSARISVKRSGSSVPTQVYNLDEGEGELGVRAGSLTVVARLGEESLTWEVTVSPEESASHEFVFGQAPVAPVAAAAAPSAAVNDEVPEGPKGGLNTLQIAGIATTGVGVLTLGGGLVTGLMSRGKENTALDQCVDVGSEGDLVCRQSAEGDFDSAKTLATVANVLYIGGGVLTAAGVGLIVGGSMKKGSTETASHLKLSPVVSPTLAGVFASGRF